MFALAWDVEELENSLGLAVILVGTSTQKNSKA